MNDPLDEFESELSRLQPASLPADLVRRVGAKLDRRAPTRRNFADRCLKLFISSGAIAASVIVCLIGWQVLEDRQPMPASPPVANGPPSIAAYQQMLARSDGPTLELLR
jgi:hypothetical protein